MQTILAPFERITLTVHHNLSTLIEMANPMVLLQSDDEEIQEFEENELDLEVGEENCGSDQEPSRF